MLGNSTDPTSGGLSSDNVKAQSKLGLRRFFQQPLIRNSVSVLIPGVLAAALFPIFGPVVAAPAAAVAIQNGLKLLGISFSATTIDKLLKPLEGKPIEELISWMPSKRYCRRISRSITKQRKRW